MLKKTGQTNVGKTRSASVKTIEANKQVGAKYEKKTLNFFFTKKTRRTNEHIQKRGLQKKKKEGAKQ